MPQENAPRFYVPDLPRTGQNEPLTLPAEESHHVAKVLRLRPHDPVELFDGRGRVGRGELSAVDRRRSQVRLQEVISTQPAHPAVHVAFAVPKGKRLDWLLEKAPELAASSLQPVVFARSVAGGDTLSEAKRQRWMGHIVSAAKQSGLNHLPQLRPMVALRELLASTDGSLRLLGDASERSVPLRTALAEAGETPDVTLLVGPEGGLNEEELAAADDAGVRRVRLGSTTLRVETAAVALLAGVRTMRDPC